MAGLRLARLLSLVFHPLLIPSLGLIVLFRSIPFLSLSLSPGGMRVLLLLVFINTALAPALSVWVMLRMGLIKDLYLDDRADRILPLLAGSVFYFMAWYLLRQLGLPSLLNFYIIGASLLVVMSLLISFWWKISLHMISLGGFSGMLYISALLLHIDLSGVIIITMIISGTVAVARLSLGAHSPVQVYTGYLLGFASMTMLYLWLRF